MRARGIAVAGALVVAMLLPTSASAATVYHGVFTGAVLNACETPDGTFDIPMPAWGVWNVTLKGDVAEVHVSIFGDFGTGPIHVDAFGGMKYGQWKLLAPGAGETFHAQLSPDPFGATDDFILSGSTLEFRITPYPPCASASSFGTLR